MRSWSLLFLLAAAGPSAAQGVPLVATGDSIPGVGTVADVVDVAVNDQGDWIALVRTASPDLDVVLKNGAVLLQTGDPLAPPGGSISGWARVLLTDAGESAWIVGTDAPTPGPALAFGATPIAFFQDPVTAPGFSPGTPYTNFHQVAMNAQRRIAASVVVDDPAIPGIVDRALVRLDVDAAGAILSQATIVKEGDVLAGTTAPVIVLPEFFDPSLSLNDAGDVIYSVETASGSAVALNQSAIVLSGDQSPVFGRVWLSFHHAPVDVNDAGDTVFAGRISGSPSSDMILVWNGIELAQEGDSIPAIEPFALRQAGSLSLNGAPVLLTDDARVFWYGEWDSPDADEDSGLFRDQELLVQEGVSFAAGQRIDEIGGFRVSDSGRFLTFLAVLADGREGAFRLDLEPASTPYSGCTAHASTLTLGAAPLLGKSMTFQVSDPQGAGAIAFVALSTAPAAGFPPCGIPFGTAGEILVDVAPPNPIAVVGPAAWLGIPGFPVFVSVQVPDVLALLGLEVYAQGLLAAPVPAEPLRLSDGLRIVLGVH